MYTCMHVYRCLTRSSEHDFLCYFMYVWILLSDRVVRDHSCVGMIAYIGEWHESGSCFYEESSGKSSPDKSMRSVSCGYELILYDYTMSMLW